MSKEQRRARYEAREAARKENLARRLDAIEQKKKARVAATAAQKAEWAAQAADPAAIQARHQRRAYRARWFATIPDRITWFTQITIPVALALILLGLCAGLALFG